MVLIIFMFFCVSKPFLLGLVHFKGILYAAKISHNNMKLRVLIICQKESIRSCFKLANSGNGLSGTIWLHSTKSHMPRCKFYSRTVNPKKQLVLVQFDMPLFWKTHCVTCVSAVVILYHVTRSCKTY